MRNVFQSPVLADAAIVRNMLVEHGIEAQLIEGQTAHGMGVTGASEVWVVRDADGDRAAELVRELERSQQTEQRHQWTCRECRESNPGAFEVCWSCSAARTW